jgi:protein-tyrosine phosphatase
MVTTAYLMYRHGWGRDEALEFVKSKRPIVRPHQAFLERLAEWEQVLKSKAGGRK